MAEPEAIEETRRLAINHVVFTTDDIMRLVNTINDAIVASPHWEADRALKQPVTLQVNATDGSSYSGGISGIANSETLGHQSVEAIEVTARNGDSRISAELHHGSEPYRGSSVRVVGRDSTWVNGTMRIIEDVIGHLEPQWRWTRRSRWALIALSELAIAAAAISIGLLVASLEPQRSALADTPWTDGLYTAIGGVIGLAGVSAGWIIGDMAAVRIAAMWPSVELRTGREYLRVEARKRKRLFLTLSLVVFPFIVSFVASIAAATVD